MSEAVLTVWVVLLAVIAIRERFRSQRFLRWLRETESKGPDREARLACARSCREQAVRNSSDGHHGYAAQLLRSAVEFERGIRG